MLDGYDEVIAFRLKNVFECPAVTLENYHLVNPCFALVKAPDCRHIETRIYGFTFGIILFPVIGAQILVHYYHNAVGSFYHRPSLRDPRILPFVNHRVCTYLFLYQALPLSLLARSALPSTIIRLPFPSLTSPRWLTCLPQHRIRTGN